MPERIQRRRTRGWRMPEGADTTVPGPDEAEIRDAIRTGIQDTTWVYDEHPERLERLVDAIVGRLVQWDIVDLAGRVVVDLPEPDEVRQRLIGPEPVFLVDGWCVRASRVDEPMVTIEVGYLGGGYGFPAERARSIAVAVLAAADASERLSVPGEVRNGQ